ncbi:Selenophosphate-dependent tRNA 2-selenouridine synthase [Prochlorococcus sp. MIT 0602]|nr:Selenophosphate-dependent tRNA 2-selenouridine synthase [Prochlorococcus sp. MIT 0602]KGG17358.1 Selenophosphate-dependent tRNA 2-selenouridine synthase [Prochlorococcus sp. MIT 0603]
MEGPLIDVRSPKEFLQGHWPGAYNIPLFNDDERALIGTTYKQKGREQAIILGLKITEPKLQHLKESLVEQSLKKENAPIRIYCWRGGLRSSSIGWLANLLGLKPVLLTGGYKAFRSWALNQFDKEWPLRLLGGKTGTGKTALLLELSKNGVFTIDLEGLANHKGSSFGGIGLDPQPSSEQFENNIALSLHNAEQLSSKGIWLEAESASLGKCRIPNNLFKQMRKAPLIEITRTKKERVSALINEYSKHKKEELKDATLRISKRLGPQRTRKALESIEKQNWEDACLAMLEYYDKCYKYELEKFQERETIDLSGLSSISSAKKLMGMNSVY